MGANIALTAGLKLQGSYNGGGNVSNIVDQLALNSNGLAYADVILAYGNGNSLLNGALQVNDWYRDELTLAATTGLNVDLYGSSYQNPFGAQLQFTALKYVFVGLVNPDGVQSLRIGPQGQSNVAQLWFGGTGATAYETEYWWLSRPGPAAGWPITPSTADILYLYNPGAAPVTFTLFLAGVK